MIKGGFSRGSAGWQAMLCGSDVKDKRVSCVGSDKNSNLRMMMIETFRALCGCGVEKRPGAKKKMGLRIDSWHARNEGTHSLFISFFFICSDQGHK